MKLPLFVLLAATLAAAADPVRDFWFSGAEISSYKLSQSRYGKNHPGHAELIFVTEPFLTDKQVKNETGKPGSTDVLKLNSLTTFNTGIYSYRTMTSTFRPIDLDTYPQALKSTTSVQDWCGQAFEQFNFKNGGWKVEQRSYFENEADQDFNLPGAHLEDGLWITLRLDPTRLPQGETRVIPGTVYTRFFHQQAAPVKAVGKLVKSGDTSTYTLSYPSLKRTLTFHFDTAFPHIIRKWTEETSTGTTTATLEHRLMNVEYWKMHNPEDAHNRTRLGLEAVAD